MAKKITDRQAYKALPALRDSLRRFKRRHLRDEEDRLRDGNFGPSIRAYLGKRLSDRRKMAPVKFRAWYQSQRVNEICRYRRSELSIAIQRMGRTLVFVYAYVEEAVR